MGNNPSWRARALQLARFAGYGALAGTGAAILRVIADSISAPLF
jgi:hypothetical protein